jgi:hypothetical protein
MSILVDDDEAAPTPKTVIVGAAALMIGIFCVDLLIPAGVLVPILYVIPLVFAFRTAPHRQFLTLTLLSCTLTLFGLLLSAPTSVGWMVYANRGLALLTIVALYLVYRVHEQTATRLEALRDLLPQCVSCKKVREDVGYWTRLEFYLEEHHIQQFTNSLCPVCEADYNQELLALKAAKDTPGIAP